MEIAARIDEVRRLGDGQVRYVVSFWRSDKEVQAGVVDVSLDLEVDQIEETIREHARRVFRDEVVKDAPTLQVGSVIKVAEAHKPEGVAT